MATQTQRVIKPEPQAQVPTTAMQPQAQQQHTPLPSSLLSTSGSNVAASASLPYSEEIPVSSDIASLLNQQPVSTNVSGNLLHTSPALDGFAPNQPVFPQNTFSQPEALGQEELEQLGLSQELLMQARIADANSHAVSGLDNIFSMQSGSQASHQFQGLSHLGEVYFFLN